MERRKLILLGVITLMIAGLVVMCEIGEAGESRGGPCKLSGNIEDTNGNNLKDVLIEIWNGSILHNQTYTNEDGYFVITDIPETTEKWKVVVRKGGYKTNVMYATIGRNTIHNVDLEDSDILYVDDDSLLGGNGSVEYPYKVIQDAINASDDGDTVRVFNGTYYENVIVNKSVSLIGTGSEVTTIDGGGSGDVVNITANWVNLSGFHVTRSGISWPDAGINIESNNNHIFENNCSNNRAGIYLRESSDCAFKNNTCENNYFGIYLDSSSNCTIENNTCSSNVDSGIYLEQSSNNTLVNNKCTGNNVGIYLGISGNNFITNSICENNSFHGMWLWYSNHCTISNSTCSSNNHYGIWLWYSSNSTIKNSTYEDSLYGINLWNSRFCTILNNTISDNRAGILLESSSRDNNAHYNNIYNNTEYGINASDTNGFSINATYDWWGHNSGPYHPTLNPKGRGDNVTDNVIFDPWIGKEEEPGVNRTWYVDDDAPPGGNGSLQHPYNRIQDAIDNATDWDIIRVFNGTYYENIIVNKSLSLIGNGSANTILESDRRDDIVQIEVDNVTVSGFTIHHNNYMTNHGIVITSNNVYIHNNNITENFEGIQIKYYNHGIRIVNRDYVVR